MTQALDKNIRGYLIALTHSDVQDQLGMTFNRYECVPVAEVWIVVGLKALLLFTDAPEAKHINTNTDASCLIAISLSLNCGELSQTNDSAAT